jgi:tetratricopeptide (TPR) repeat protein
MIAQQTQHYESAVKLFCRAIALNGEAAQYHNSLGNVRAAMKRIPEATQSYRRAIDPTLATAHFGLGTLAYRNNGYTGAAALVPQQTAK